MGFFSKSIWKETKQPEKNFFFLSCRKCTLNRCLPVSLSDLYNVLYLCRIDCCFNNVACYINTNSKEFVQRAVFDVVVVAVFVVTFFLEGVKRGGGFLFFYNTKSNLKKKKTKKRFFPFKFICASSKERVDERTIMNQTLSKMEIK